MKLNNTKIGEVANEVYRRHFGDDVIESVSASDFIDSTGEEAVRIDIMIKRGMVGRLKGDILSDAALDLQEDLTKAGEQRFAHPSFGEVGEVFETVDEKEDFGEVEVEIEENDARS